MQALLAFADRNPLFAALLVFQVFDILSGLAAAGVQRKLSSPISYAGMIRKFVVIMVIFTAQMMDWTALKLFIIQTPIAGAVMWYFIVREVVSITENVALAGIPIPDVIKNRLAVLQDMDVSKVIAITGGMLQTGPADAHSMAAVLKPSANATVTTATITTAQVQTQTQTEVKKDDGNSNAG